MADGEYNIDPNDMRAENRHQGESGNSLCRYISHQRACVTDIKWTKPSRKRKAPMDDISGKHELEREPSKDRELGADNKNDAVIGESCEKVPGHCGALDLLQAATPANTTIAKKSTQSKKFWYYQTVSNDEPKPVDMIQQDEQLGKLSSEPYGKLY